ncbi:hypothetical protein CW304_02995 [Bacillus sp. UFRGS-B20]|nr:hypothetical protein CW304_02995 [Bacillus sp. UFRGS-B20]
MWFVVQGPFATIYPINQCLEAFRTASYEMSSPSHITCGEINAIRKKFTYGHLLLLHTDSH